MREWPACRVTASCWRGTPASRGPASLAAGSIFPASTLGRKGAYELREAARTLTLPLFLLGPVLEAPGFWDGVNVVHLDVGGDWLAEAAVVVLPAWIENRPARLLKALACGLPVIATAAYGLPPQAHLTLLASGDADALTAALRAFAPLSRAAETQLV